MSEQENLEILKRHLAKGFDTWCEVPLRHALFRRRTLRVDLIAFPRDPRFSDIALAFEVKGHEQWDGPRYAKALKQASDYVLATVDTGIVPPEHNGKRVMGVFLWPGKPEPELDDPYPEYERGRFYGMAHLAGYFRVGTASYTDRRGTPVFCLRLGEQLWFEDRGWRASARNVLVGKRQIGSQRFPILDELEAMSGGRK